MPLLIASFADALTPPGRGPWVLPQEGASEVGGTAFRVD
jgi:hypothetical protein